MTPATPRRAWFGPVYERGPVGHNHCALTFDDGPLEGATADILDILKARNVTATFFVIGDNVRQWPGLVQRMAAEGHIVANHTWSHWRLSMFCPATYWRREIRKTDELIRSVIGRQPALFRPPMGVRTPSTVRAIHLEGHACIMWTRRAMDGVATTRQRIVDRLMTDLADGAVLLLHDGREAASKRDPKATIDALPDVIDGIHARGLRIASLESVLGFPAYHPTANDAPPKV